MQSIQFHEYVDSGANSEAVCLMGVIDHADG